MKSLAKIQKKLITNKHFFILFVLAFFTLLTAVSVYAAIYNYWYQGRIYPGIYVGEIYLGGLKPNQAQTKLSKNFYEFEKSGINFSFNQELIKIKPTITSPDNPDLAYQIIEFKTKETANKAWLTGRTGFWWNKFYSPVFRQVFSKKIVPEFALDEKKLLEALRLNISKFENPEQEVTIKWNYNKFELIDGWEGKIFDYQQIMAQTKSKIKALDSSPVKLELYDSPPQITLEKIDTEQKNQLEKLAISQPILIWKAENHSEIIPFGEYNNNLKFSLNQENEINLNLNESWLTQELAKIKEKIDQPSQDARFEINNGRVQKFQQSRDGKMLDINTNTKLINQNFENKQYSSDLKIEIDRAKIQAADLNNLGISEIIGIGTSDFSGSPPNRIHNINVGADSLNGLLIKPGEEFSLLKNLLPIDSSRGYLPELVIKGNETVPEYGGGLCQIGTTAFRSALASGLPITQRRNHSYRVSYYEPAGTDATIYDPAPDFRFLNDTPGHILIQTKTEGNSLIFEFWGTNDGRLATSTYPKIYNIITPPATKYIETLELEPGQIKCTERAHNGADAEFTYTVTYPSGEKKEKIFTSHYRPWQEVCLKGVEEISTSTEGILE